MSRYVFIVAMGLALLMLSAQSQAQGPALEFSAEAVQMAPDQQIRTARMYVGHERVRKEYIENGQQVAEIIDWGRGRVILLMPEQQTYMDSNTAEQAQVLPRRAGEDTNPCLNMPSLQCRYLGQETLSGRRVDKWEMLAQHDGITERSLHWIDPQRQMPLQQILPDGRLTELTLIGQQTLNGRQVEHWEQSTSLPDGVVQRVSQWYDPQLQIAIREELPGGYFRELRNIVVAKQPAQLFEVPAGYQRLERPARTLSGASENTSTVPAPR